MEGADGLVWALFVRFYILEVGGGKLMRGGLVYTQGIYIYKKTCDTKNYTKKRSK